MHGILYLDKAGNALSPLMNWQDGRGDQHFKDNQSYAKVLSDITGYPMATGYGLTTHFYNLQTGLVPENATKICTIHDYAAMKLAGLSTPVTHSSNAASFGLFDLKELKFDIEAITRAKMNPYFLPTLQQGICIIGTYQGKIPISVPIGDNQASFLGSVKDLENSLCVNIGTSSQISAYTGKYCTHDGFETRPFLEKDYLMVGSPLCGGRAYALLENFFRQVLILADKDSTQNLYESMNHLAMQHLEDENKLKIDTRFAGTRQEPLVRGEIQNLGTDNFTPGHMIAGVLEGIVRELKDSYRSMQNAAGLQPSGIICSGNAVRYNPALLKILSEKFELPFQFPQQTEEAATGAALSCCMALEKAGL